MKKIHYSEQFTCSCVVKKLKALEQWEWFKNSFAEKLLLCWEGSFSSFCAIYWLKKKGVMQD